MEGSAERIAGLAPSGGFLSLGLLAERPILLVPSLMLGEEGFFSTQKRI